MTVRGEGASQRRARSGDVSRVGPHGGLASLGKGDTWTQRHWREARVKTRGESRCWEGHCTNTRMEPCPLKIHLQEPCPPALQMWRNLDTRLSRGESVSLSGVSDSLQPRGPTDPPAPNTGAGCHFLLQAIFLTQGSNPSLLHWQADSSLSEPSRGD